VLDLQGAPHSCNAHPTCFVCGRRNTRGLQVVFREDINGVFSDWIPGEGLESFQGIIHGGVISAVLDEAMARAVIAGNCKALTVDLRVRFRASVCPGAHLHIHGWIVDKGKRKISTEATLTTPTGREQAHAWATFLVVE